jgi:hypothetical protein
MGALLAVDPLRIDSVTSSDGQSLMSHQSQEPSNRFGRTTDL